MAWIEYSGVGAEAANRIGTIQANKKRFTICTPVNLWRSFRVEGMARFFVEFILQLEAFSVGLDGAERGYKFAGPFLHVKFAERFGGEGAFTCIVVRKTRVPPNRGVQRVGEVQALLV